MTFGHQLRKNTAGDIEHLQCAPDPQNREEALVAERARARRTLETWPPPPSSTAWSPINALHKSRD